MRLTETPLINHLAGTHSVMLNQGGALKQMTVDQFRQGMNENDEAVLNELAFYVDTEKHCSRGEAYVDVGGNLGMRQLWEDAKIPVLMDKDGNYYPLNRNDFRFLDNGTQIITTTETTVEGETVRTHTWAANTAKYQACDWMIIIPKYYGRIQHWTVTAQSSLDPSQTLTWHHYRPWFSLVPLPGGYEIPQQVVGMFKATVVDGALRSIPLAVPAATNTIYQFWQKAQVRSKNHGLANLDFRNYLLVHMMSKYGWRDCQNCKNSGNTLVWGVGLDGTEKKSDTATSDNFARQKDIQTGATISFGVNDSKAAVLDADSGKCHSVNVAGFENPWGQYWEMVGGLASVGNDVYCWRSNFIPSSAPTAATFANVPHALLQRWAISGSNNSTVRAKMNLITGDGQGLYMIPKQSVTGITYGDNYWCADTGQLWLWGGSSLYGASCGLVCASSASAWTHSYAFISARLAYYGDITKKS